MGWINTKMLSQILNIFVKMGSLLTMMWRIMPIFKANIITKKTINIISLVAIISFLIKDMLVYLKTS